MGRVLVMSFDFVNLGRGHQVGYRKYAKISDFWVGSGVRCLSRELEFEN